MAPVPRRRRFTCFAATAIGSYRHQTGSWGALDRGSVSVPWAEACPTRGRGDRRVRCAPARGCGGQRLVPSSAAQQHACTSPLAARGHLPLCLPFPGCSWKHHEEECCHEDTPHPTLVNPLLAASIFSSFCTFHEASFFFRTKDNPPPPLTTDRKRGGMTTTPHCLWVVPLCISRPQGR